MARIRNFCIIAHIDHGKSTMADRFLEVTKTVEIGKHAEQMLDSMDLERERGITIKLQPVRMFYESGGERYELNLIDTPGHSDFAYEVSRSLMAVEGAILLVDATQGIQAQTLANLLIAQQHNLKIIPVVNKIDLPNAEPERVAFELAELLKINLEEILLASGKTGQGVDAVLERVIRDVPAPSQMVGHPEIISGSNNLSKQEMLKQVPPSVSKEQVQDNTINEALTALVFDSSFDTFRGVVAQVRVMTGSIKRGDTVLMMATGQKWSVEEVGYQAIDLKPTAVLTSGQIGYVITGLKRVSDCRVGDTMTLANHPAETALEGYRQPQAVVFASLFEDSGETMALRTAIEKLAANDAALTYEPFVSEAFGSGFRMGFLGLLHLEITKERLEREFNLGVIVTTPQVNILGDVMKGYQEPWIHAEIVTPSKYLGAIMDLLESRRGLYKSLRYLGEDVDGVIASEAKQSGMPEIATSPLAPRNDSNGGGHANERLSSTVVVDYELPLMEVITDFHDMLKSVSTGYASFSYDIIGYRASKLAELNILIAGEKVPPFTQFIPVEQVENRARKLTQRLKELIPRQMFEVSIQAAVGGRIVARETIPAMRKDVTAKLYGGDFSRKRKLLEKQKEGKKKMRQIGRVSLPTDVFLAALKPPRS